jgi:hypothetical protein
MSSNNDAWYVRFPDGRVLRANSTAIVRQQLGAGRIPFGSTVRRSPDEEWTSIEWSEEFADVVAEQRKLAEVGTASGRPSGRPPSSPLIDVATGSGVRPLTVPPPPGSTEGSGVAARLDPNRLQTVGVRGLVDELIGALDSTLVRKKIAVALMASLALGLLFAFAPLQPLSFSEEAARQNRALAAVAVLLVGSMATALLTRMTFVEVSRLRPARWSEAFKGFFGLSLRLAIAELVIAGNTLLILEVLRILPGYFLNSDPLEGYVAKGLTANIALIVAMIAEVMQWPVFGLSFLLAPILTVENCSIGTALLQWFRLVRRQFGRAFVYEALALGVGVIITLPLYFPIQSLGAIYRDAHFLEAVAATQVVLKVMALGPLFAYLVVANVFIYLNLRYELGATRR